MAPRGGTAVSGLPIACVDRLSGLWAGTGRPDGSVGDLAVPHAFCLAFLTGVIGQLRAARASPGRGGLRVLRVSFCVSVLASC